jgi:hypothetical protein
MLYFILMLFIIVLYAFGLTFMKKMKNTRFFNLLFTSLVVIFYLYCLIHIYRDVGSQDWNFTNALPTANVSPFTYCLTPFIFIFPKKIRPYFLALLALLSFGLMCAGLLTCIGNIARNYAFHLTIALDTLSHAILSFLGVYLYQSKQIELTKQISLIGGSIIVGVAALMLVLNLIFHTSFFGLSLYGNHNIYNFVLVDNGYLSALIYFVGLCCVLIIGYFHQKFINYVLNKK